MHKRFEEKFPRKEISPCLRNGDDVDLDIVKAYESLPDDKASTRDMVRVVDESDENYLYPKDWFMGIALPQTAKTYSFVKHEGEEAIKTCCCISTDEPVCTVGFPANFLH